MSTGRGFLNTCCGAVPAKEVEAIVQRQISKNLTSLNQTFQEAGSVVRMIQSSFRGAHGHLLSGIAEYAEANRAKLNCSRWAVS